MTDTLIQYIETEIIPQYAAFDKAHQEDHARAVIARALEMGRNYPINEDMLYTAAACHDLGLAVDRKTHHLESGKIIRNNVKLREWFTADQIETIAQAAEDHRVADVEWLLEAILAYHVAGKARDAPEDRPAPRIRQHDRRGGPLQRSDVGRR